MIHQSIKKIIKLKSFQSDLLGTFFQNWSVRGPIQANRIFSGAFVELFEKDVSLVREDWMQRSFISDALRGSQIGLLLTVPVIWSVAIPLMMLDVIASLYQVICFPIYGIPIVDRSEFVIIDRYKLNYLSWIEKINCVYCEYGNGVLAYVREIASRTEERWCPIKHVRHPKDPHGRYTNFADYGDAHAFIRKEQARKYHKEKMS
ncbi:MAG: hypothetical protein H7839_11790 [Magnetococcus sp. YQC-5]